jgi:hypothetical protein
MDTTRQSLHAELKLIGSYCTFDALAIWKAKTEGKHRFFTWLLVQRKILAADKLLARNWRPRNPVCPLCDREPETAEHLCVQCVFAQEVWFLVATWSEDALQVPGRLRTFGVPVEHKLGSSNRCCKKQACGNYDVLHGVEHMEGAKIGGFSMQSLQHHARVLRLIRNEIAMSASACGVSSAASSLIMSHRSFMRDESFSYLAGLVRLQSVLGRYPATRAISSVLLQCVCAWPH